MPAILILAALFLVVHGSGPAHAAPVFTAIGGLVSAIKGSAILSALARIGGSMLLSKLAEKLAPKPKQPGIKTEITLTGATNPLSFIMGRYATAGVFVCPPMSHGPNNTYLTYVIELSDLPGIGLHQWMIDGETVTLGATPHPTYGRPVDSGRFANHAWIKVYDGWQTTADAGLVSTYGTYPQRPWSSAMVGRGIAYAICTFLYNRDIFTAFPNVRFVLDSARLYDPRQDSTAGGSGTQRWNNPNSWGRTDNPVVMAYNIHRGVAIGGAVWGGRNEAADLPLSEWFAAMNACDALVDNGAGGTEPRFRAGYEVTVDQEPASVLEVLMDACLGDVADVGGRWRIVAGDPPLPVLAITDADLLGSVGGEKVRFLAPQETFNAISGSYPAPQAQWEAQSAPVLTNATWEAEDGGQRLPVQLDLPAVPYPAQVQRIHRSTIAQARRVLQHSEPLPPDLTWIDPLDSLTWTSARHGYAAKEFQIGRVVEDLDSGVISLSFRERDPGDTTILPGYFTPPDSVSLLPSSGPGLQTSTLTLGVDWNSTGLPVTLTPASPTANLSAWLQSVDWSPALRGGTAIFAIECTLTAAARRQIRLTSSQLPALPRQVDELVFAAPGSITRLTGVGALPDLPGGAVSLGMQPRVDVQGLLTGEQLVIHAFKAQIVYLNR